MLFDAHNHAFRVFGGVPERGIYDNMKTAVDKVGRGKQRTINQRFSAMASHYLFEPDFCNPAAGWEKGQVEKAVQDGRYALWHKAPMFDSLADLNVWLECECLHLWQHSQHPETPELSIVQCWQQEQRHLMKVTAPFDGFVEHSKRVTSTCLVVFETNKYSVPASFANRRISLRVYPDKLECIAEGRKVAEHRRVFTRDHSVPGKVIYDWQHYLDVNCHHQKGVNCLTNTIGPIISFWKSVQRQSSKIEERPLSLMFTPIPGMHFLTKLTHRKPARRFALGHVTFIRQKS